MSELETITTSIVFITGDTCNRDGTKEDVNAIVGTFRKIFNSEVHNWIDFPPNELRTKIREIKTQKEWLDKFKQCNFVAIFCLAHGASDGQICVHHGQEKKHVKNIKTTFLNPLFKIAELDGKLKWLIVQSCRGNYNDLAKSLNMQTDGDLENVLYIKYYLISYCTGEGTLSAQENARGKLYIQEICKEIAQNARTKTLIQMLLSVNSTVEEYSRENNYENFSRPVLDINCPNDYSLI